jgi:hypothetical protein
VYKKERNPPPENARGTTGGEKDGAIRQSEHARADASRHAAGGESADRNRRTDAQLGDQPHQKGERPDANRRVEHRAKPDRPSARVDFAVRASDVSDRGEHVSPRERQAAKTSSTEKQRSDATEPQRQHEQPRREDRADPKRAADRTTSERDRPEAKPSQDGEIWGDLGGVPLEVIEARKAAALEAINLQTQSVLASLFVGIAIVGGDKDPEHLRDAALAGYVVGEFAGALAGTPDAVRLRNPRADSAPTSKTPHEERPIRTAQSVVQEKVDEFVKDFHRDPAKIADYLSPHEVAAVADAVHQYRAQEIKEGGLTSALGRAFGKAVERRTVEWGKQENLIPTGQSRDAHGRFTSSPDLLFSTGEFKGQRIEITTFRAWAAHAARDWGLDVDVHYAGYEIDYPAMLRSLLRPPR